ncbi:concanavalin A-like lectin/glucanase domain-containing protein [Auriculariales sp. MPI-PUGE-AT-0066]|nr:concanavalin A-like lectin/glucanase domain-containing protein [Auriculariales sp. MPI-PUGE-AT-0066]
MTSHGMRFSTQLSIVVALVANSFPFIAAAAASSPIQNPYLVKDVSTGSSFYDNFDFDNISDPTHGRVVYVDKATAQGHNLTYAAPSGSSFVLRTDATTVLTSGGPGRESVRLRSKNLYGTHVVIIDLAHMPVGCGTWPAIWEFGPNLWPDDGEVDILEGVNDLGPNGSTLHTNGTTCRMSNLTQKGTLYSTDCDADVNYNQGCMVKMSQSKSYGPAFNSAGGGWFALEKTDEYIKVWFWSRNDDVPASVKAGSPVVDPNYWGQPEVWFNNRTCDIANRFKPANIIINLTLCGDWAGETNTWRKTSCASKWPTCKGYVEANPAALSDAYFDIKALRVYERPSDYQTVDTGENPDYPTTTLTTASSSSTSSSTGSTSTSTAGSSSSVTTTATSTSSTSKPASTSTSSSSAGSTTKPTSTSTSKITTTTSTSKTTAKSSTSKTTAKPTTSSKTTAKPTSTKTTTKSKSTSKTTAKPTSSSKTTAKPTSTSKSTVKSTSTSKSTVKSTSTSKSTVQVYLDE